MCDPITIGLATFQASSQVQAGKAASKEANAQAREAEYQGALAMDDARVQARMIRREGEIARGETLAGIAASGVKIGEGSALEAERQVMEDFAVDEEMMLLTGKRNQRQAQTTAANARRAGRNAQRTANIGAFTSLLSAGASGLKTAGWGSKGPGFSGQQAPAPIVDLSFRGGR
jgi:hypothetical protein